MLRFRPPQPDAPTGDLADALVVAQMIDDAMKPGNFFVAADLRLTWIAARSETIAWEVFRGRVLDATQTREQRTFLSWHVIEENATESTVSVKFDVAARHIHVTRGIQAYVWEAYDAGRGVIESREVVKWTRELVGTIALTDFANLADVQDELVCQIWQAIVGTSRLPLTSVEAPLPAYTFGKLHYVYRNDAGTSPMSSSQDLATCWSESNLVLAERAKLMELVLRRSILDTMHFSGAIGYQTMSVPLWRAMFNSVSLSPFTQFVGNAFTMIGIGTQLEDAIDFCADLLCKLSRHLQAYDLVTFHHRGANYPDALLLNAVLDRYLSFASFSEFFLGNESNVRRRRRALRQGCLLYRHYEGFLVPDLPTSPGENVRVLPASHPRVPDEQITQVHRRHKQLFSDEPLRTLLANVARGGANAEIRAGITSRVRAAIEACIRDLAIVDERVEMGMGLFIDRPLGYSKAIGEPDLTPMLAHEAFSPSIARRRWQELKKLCAELGIECDTAMLDPLFENGPWPAGLPHSMIAECPRPTAALCDLRKVADDFVILRTKPVGLAAMLELCGINAELAKRAWLCVPIDDGGQPTPALFDRDLRRIGLLRVDAAKGFCRRAGVEVPWSVRLEQ